MPLFLFLFWALSVGLDLSRLQHVQHHLCCTHNEFRHSLNHPRLFDSLFQRDAAHDVLMLVFFHRNEFDCFFSYCLRVHSGLHSHEVTVHCNGGPSRLVFAPLLGDVVMRAPSAHHAMCAPVSERNVCCLMLFSFLLCWSVPGSCPHTPVWCRQPLFAVHSISSFN